MPFGMHKGKPLGDVPAKYLLWLWDSGYHSRRGCSIMALHDYLRSALPDLLKECPDYILEHELAR